MAKAAKPAAGTGHNSGFDPAQEKAFIREFQNVKDEEAAMAGSKGTLAQIYKRLENAGFSKEHIAFAKTLEKKNVSEVMADMEMRIKICRVMGHAAGRQLDFLDKDRTPIEDQAYTDGYSAGKFGRPATNPYGMETMAGQRWQQGFNDGNVFRNEALAEAISGDNLIKGGGESEDQNKDDETEEEQTEDGDGDGVDVTNALDGVAIPPGEETPVDDWDAADPNKAA